MFGSLNDWRPQWLSNWIIVGFTAIICFYEYSTWKFKTFKKLGIKGPTPLPFVGNLFHLYWKGITKFDMELKQKYGLIVGCFNSREPFLHIYDTHILKQILIKDFNLFVNHLDLGVMDPPMDKMILILKDDHWRHVRSILSPTFSSGKLRKISSQMNQCCETLCENLRKKAESGEIFDFRVLSGAFAMDAIASTAFGVEIDSHNDPENMFVKQANKIFKFRISLSIIIYLFFPFLYKPLSYLGLSLMDKSVIKFFTAAIQKALKQREKGSDRTDFLQIMLNAHLEDHANEDDQEPKDSTKTKITKGLTNDELLAQGFLFFLAGYETTSNAMAFFAYCMATNPDVQERLYTEIVENIGDDEPSYDSIRKLVYLDMCLSETLRMYPPASRTDRVAAEDITIDGLFIPKGMVICVPIYALHHDPEYWNEPSKFDPERFSASNQPTIDPLYYMPFGLGPRNCVGMRLALLEIKMAFVKILRKFELRSCKETEIPLILHPTAIKGKNGVKIKVVKRD